MLGQGTLGWLPTSPEADVVDGMEEGVCCTV